MMIDIFFILEPQMYTDKSLSGGFYQSELRGKHTQIISVSRCLQQELGEPFTG
ncbi:MAG: hypothetical protein V7K40_24615 [Nostoc sp.]|uniref:hypothetical protein n=1 Tax=Nostoc sp. TaxID=1180 RepID=UPI002FF5C151